MKKSLSFTLTALILSATTSAMAETKPAAAEAEGDPKRGKIKAETVCVACHGTNGNSTNSLWPKLAGQHASYIEKQLHDFINDKRADPAMTPMAKPLKPQEIKDISAYYATQAQQPGMADETKAEAGRILYKGGNMTKGITACAACHGPAGDGNPAAKYPKIAGQQTDYLIKTLKDFKEGNRTNSPAGMMSSIVKRMSEEDIQAVAEYVSGLRE